MKIVLRVFACLSPEEIGISIRIAAYAAAFALVVASILVILNWRRRDFRWFPVYGVLLVVHPAWSMSVYDGDCGYAQRLFSVMISVVLASILLCQLWRSQMSVRFFLLILAVLCWIAFGASQLYRQMIDYTWLLDLLSRIVSPGAIESFVLASSTLFKVSIVITVVCALLYGIGWWFPRGRRAT